jgi:hypothetical protein
LLSIYQNDNKREQRPTDQAAENKKRTGISAWSARCRNKSEMKPCATHSICIPLPFADSDSIAISVQRPPQIRESNISSLITGLSPRFTSAPDQNHRAHSCVVRPRPQTPVCSDKYFILLRSHFLRYCSIQLESPTNDRTLNPAFDPFTYTNACPTILSSSRNKFFTRQLGCLRLGLIYLGALMFHFYT